MQNYKGIDIRNSTDLSNVIFYMGVPLETQKGGAMNSQNGIVLSAQLPTGEHIKWRSNANGGRKGFSYDRPFFGSVKKDNLNRLPVEISNKLEFKL